MTEGQGYTATKHLYTSQL